MNGIKGLALIGLIVVLVSMGCVLPRDNGSGMPYISGAAVAPVLTVTQKYFPASECIKIHQNNCDSENKYNASFNLTYTVGSNNLSGGLKIAFGFAEINKTTGYYAYWSRAFNRGSGVSRWAESMLQNTSSSSLNYVKVSTTNNGVGVDIVDILYDGLNITVNGTLIEGDNVTIEFHNLLQPGINFENDLMVLEDTNNDSTYQHIIEKYTDITEYPKLIITGWNLTRFDVIAPSRTNGSEFNITVRAVDERSGLYSLKQTPAYIIRNYTGTISFTSSDSNAVLPDDYTFTLADRGTHEFNVMLNTIGIQNITVNASTITGVSNPISINDSDYDNYKIYWWGRHVHTFMGGHATQTPTYAYLYARDDSALDVFSLSDHCGWKFFNWSYQRELPALYYVPGEFVGLQAYEYGPANTPWVEEGHRNILFKNSSGRTVYCSKKLGTDTAVIGGKNLKELSDYYANDSVFATYHHSLQDIQKNFRWQNTSDENETKLHKFIEIYSIHGSSEYRYNNPFLLANRTDSYFEDSNESSTREGIAKGHVLGIIAGTDNHKGKAGAPGTAQQQGASSNYAQNGLTAIYAENLTYDGIWDALDNRRTYGTTGARAIIEFKTVNGDMMGSADVYMNNITLSARVVGTGTLDTIAIMRNGTSQVYTYYGSSFDESFNWTDSNTTVGNTYSYYMWFNQTDGITYGWSSPIWITKVP